MASGNTIEINAGTGGKVKKMTVAAFVDGGVNNEVSGAPVEDKVDGNKGNDRVVINGPAGDVQIEDLNLVGRIRGGMNNKIVNTQTGTTTEGQTVGNREREETSMVLENMTIDNLDGLQ